MFEDEGKQVREAAFILQRRVSDVNAVRRLRESFGLDCAESEAIILSDEMHADLMLMDEKKRRRIAENRGIAVMGTVGLLLTAYREGRLSGEEMKQIVTVMRTLDRHISAELFEYLLRAVDGSQTG